MTDAPRVAPQMDQIWANEGGIMVRFMRDADVVISIIEQSSDRVLASATLTGWRWDRAVAAMKTERCLWSPAGTSARCKLKRGHNGEHEATYE